MLAAATLPWCLQPLGSSISEVCNAMLLTLPFFGAFCVFHLLCDLSVSKGSDGRCLGKSIHTRKAYIDAALEPSV